MQNSDNVIQLAKERALFGFSALVQKMLVDARSRIAQLLTEASPDDLRPLRAARDFVDSTGKLFVKRVDTQYRAMLERGLQTMYKTDWRVAIGSLSADNLTLIDDETVTTQIEVDRLVIRLRDADDENLRRVNIIIAQMHGDMDVRERENPFRPYLMAHSLHFILRDMVTDEEVNKRLFALFSDALASQLTNFYALLRQVFETSGMHAKLLTQKSRFVGKLDDRDDFRGGYAPEVSARVLPGLQRMLDHMNGPTLPVEGEAGGAHGGAAGGSGGGAGGGTGGSGGTGGGGSGGPGGSGGSGGASYGGQAPMQPQQLQQFVEGLFTPAHDAQSWPALNADPHAPVDAAGQTSTAQGNQAGQAGPKLQPGSAELMGLLNQFQQQAAHGKALNEQLTPEQNQLFALGEQLGVHQANKLEKVAIDVVAMLFELILGDEQIPAGMRSQIGLLQIPFLKAALQTPDMLQHVEHPARQLVNRMGTAAMAIDPATPFGQGLEQEINRIVHKILNEFGDDPAIFSDCMLELETYLEGNLPQSDIQVSSSVGALQEIEQSVVQSAPLPVPDWLRDFRIDSRVVEFIVKIWLPVVELEALHRDETDAGPAQGPYQLLLPDLIWSAQDKQSIEERTTLMRMLPQLVGGLKSGLAALRLPEHESRAAFDQLVAVHTQVLRANPTVGSHTLFSLAEMRSHFSHIIIGHEGQPIKAVESEKFESELAKRGVALNLDLEREDDSPVHESDVDWLTHMQMGTCVERWSDVGYQLARLTWISKRKTLYMFMLEEKTMPIVYSAASLIKALREGSVCLLESAPVFERAVETLLSGARSLEAGVRN